eukprot:snap_masked-scaffold1923_size24897-processed-gene-0.5 protein:Tk01741 transcript:snap_masked-scaffold1923_size24897-processed-gene-0.5-mRNA-1 annotation:"hypothetical protein DAPPUDRAFT_269522"
MAAVPEYPFQDVGADLFSLHGRTFLILVDCMSLWFEIHRFTNDPSSGQVIKCLRRWFCQFGIPARLRSDNGHQLRSQEFSAFLARYSVCLSLTTPYNPRSNGLAESAVKAAKTLLGKCSPSGDIDCDAFQMGILELRNTPTESGHSPAEGIRIETEFATPDFLLLR